MTRAKQVGRGVHKAGVPVSDYELRPASHAQPFGALADQGPSSRTLIGSKCRRGRPGVVPIRQLVLFYAQAGYVLFNLPKSLDMAEIHSEIFDSENIKSP